MILKYVVLAVLVFASRATEGQEPFVRAELIGQLGNQMFQIATASAVAWDNGAEPHFPDHAQATRWLINYAHVFFRCDMNDPGEVEYQWSQPGSCYAPITYRPNMKISGYFQSEKYFSHQRERILELFAPNSKDLQYMNRKYRKIIEHPQTVGIQIRYYKWEFPTSDLYPQYGRQYLEKAMALFPQDALFVVSSNNIEFAKNSIPPWATNVVFLEKEAPYIDLYLLSFCKHNIITNSSFGWWAAWLNKNPDKMIICPAVWDGIPTQDIAPDRWIKIDAPGETQIGS
jgi:hypothetical protein